MRSIDKDVRIVILVYLGGCLVSILFFGAVAWIVAAAFKWATS